MVARAYHHPNMLVVPFGFELIVGAAVVNSLVVCMPLVIAFFAL